MKKLLNKKVLGAVLALLLALGVCDLTIMEQSHLKPVLQDLQKSATSLFDDAAEEAPKTLIQGTEAPAEAE
jgi:hypothetical protein